MFANKVGTPSGEKVRNKRNITIQRQNLVAISPITIYMHVLTVW